MDNTKTLFIKGTDTGCKIFVADTLLKRFWGWMLRKRPLNEGLLLSPCSSIHTFFMRFNINVVFLNSRNIVVKVTEHVRPFRITLPVKDACKVLELPADSIRTFTIKAGDVLEFR